MAVDYKEQVTMNPSGFVLLADYVPGIIQEIRYHSTYNFVGERIEGYEEPCAILTQEAAQHQNYVQLAVSQLALEHIGRLALRDVGNVRIGSVEAQPCGAYPVAKVQPVVIAYADGFAQLALKFSFRGDEIGEADHLLVEKYLAALAGGGELDIVGGADEKAEAQMLLHL